MLPINVFQIEHLWASPSNDSMSIWNDPQITYRCRRFLMIKLTCLDNLNLKKNQIYQSDICPCSIFPGYNCHTFRCILYKMLLIIFEHDVSQNVSWGQVIFVRHKCILIKTKLFREREKCQGPKICSYLWFRIFYLVGRGLIHFLGMGVKINLLCRVDK